MLAVGGASAYLTRRPFPVEQGQLRVLGLQAPVEVIRDRWGVPHLFAQNDHDLSFAQGYVHAQDRLWQMELNRRTASGRLSEIFGPVTVETDRFLRTIGLRRAAEGDLTALDAQAREALEAYASGVNAFIAQHRHRLPVEFTILRFAPEPWTIQDSLAFAKLMAWVLGGNWESEILRAHVISRFGDDGARVLLPPYPGEHPVIVPEPAVSAAFRSAAVLKLLDLAPRRSGLGSNNWVLSGARTATGRPILANDPHLEAQMPSVWYEMHLSGGGSHAIGSTFPGVPGVVIGHNEQIAWGVTNAGPDVMDLYMERFDPNDPTRYEYQGRWETAQIIREEIAVKGREPVVEHVRVTRHGPIINTIVEGLDAFLALRWTALEPSTVAASVLALGRARNWTAFRDALRLWSVPAQNFVYADRDGNIGYQLSGRIPVRAKGQGLVPVPGWTGEYEWTGEIPFDELPSALNPPRGYILTANNRIVPEGYRHFISAEWDPGFRARRIEAMLRASPKVSLDDLKRVQTDVTSLPGQITVRALRDARVNVEPAAGLLRDLQRWNGVLAPDSRGAAAYEAFRVALVAQVFKPVLGPDLFKRYLERAEFWQVALLQILQNPSSAWWGPDGRDAVITRALNEAHRTLTEKLGSDASRWRWGRLHVMRFVHPIGRIGPLSWIFNATAPETGGDGFTVNNAAFSVRTFEQGVVASYRQLIDAADWDRSLMIHTTGQSGLPLHRHYRDFVPLWATGQYHPMLFSRSRIQQEGAGTLTLTPP